jgi:hypothetical protein
MGTKPARPRVWTGSILLILLALASWVFPGPSSGATVPDPVALLPRELPEGWAKVDGPHRYTRKTLFEHVDGQAVLYLTYGFRGSAFAVYQERTGSGRQIEFDLCDMGTVLQAFGIYSRLRSEGKPGGVGLDAIGDERSFLFYQDRFFVMGYASEPAAEELREMARRVAARLPGRSAPPPELSFFPRADLVPGSIQYFAEGLLGHRFLKRGFQAGYGSGGEEGRLFLAPFGNVREAGEALKAFQAYLKQKGALRKSGPGMNGLPGLEAEDPYQGELIVAVKGSVLAGAQGFKERPRAEMLLAELIRNLKNGR